MKHLLRISALLTVFVAISAFQIIKTQLHITVRDELGNTVEEATVQLFENEDDYLKEENIVAEATTDKKGIARFKELKDIPYHVIVRKDDKDNSGGGEKTDKLDAKRINKVTIIIQ
jgi:hypothetical protein